MENSVAYCSDFREILDTSIRRILKHLKNVVDGFSVGWRNELVVELFFATRLLLDCRVFLADAFYDTDC